MRKYDIDPEFEILKKFPVITSRRQIRLVQLMFKDLPGKERSTDTLLVKKELIPARFSPDGSLHSLIYTPVEFSDKPSPCVLFLHGGAFVFPALPYHFRLARKIAVGVGCRVVMPIYDLAPSFKPPLQQEEAFDVYCCLKDKAGEYCIEPEKTAVIGDSAGGTLCAALMLMLRDRGISLPAAQALLYPSLDTRFQSESVRKYPDVPVCNSNAVIKYLELCHNDAPGKREYISPLEAASLKGMPVSYVETAEFDCLHDDGIAYAKRLLEEGCNVELNETKGTVHAFDMAKNSTILKRVMEQRIAFLKSNLYG